MEAWIRQGPVPPSTAAAAAENPSGDRLGPLSASCRNSSESTVGSTPLTSSADRPDSTVLLPRKPAVRVRSPQPRPSDSREDVSN